MLGCLLQAAFAQTAETQQAAPKPEAAKAEESLFDHFVTNQIEAITLTSDFKTIRKNRFKEDYYPGKLHFTGKDGATRHLPVSVRTRGSSRKRVCKHPSLKLKIEKKELKAAGFKTDNKYKIVCQCRSDKSSLQLLLKEYLAYKLYNLLSDYSYQVYLLQIHYLQSDSDKPESRYAILLESKKGIEARLSGEIIDRDELKLDNISRKASIRLHLFQYMIGNTDWGISFMHNVKLLLQDDGQLIPIPYDFDYAGLVNAAYAAPNPDYPIDKTTERYFQKEGCTAEEINEQLATFKARRTAILTSAEQVPLLNGSSRQFLRKFLHSFFKTIDDPDKVVAEFVR